MNKQTILYAALALVYYHIAGLATTNILRLTKGNRLSVLSSKCTCDCCGSTIPPFLQLPILSFVFCKGRCRQCHTKIPVYPLFLEIVVFLGMWLLSFAFHLSLRGVSVSFLYYELVRIITIIILGKRETEFAKNYAVAVVSLLPLYCAGLFVALIYAHL